MLEDRRNPDVTPWDGRDVPWLVSVERLGENLFQDPHNQVCGNQVLGQSLSAAAATVADRSLHSMRGYFLRPARWTGWSGRRWSIRGTDAPSRPAA